jgi:hypothetical protein
MKKMGDECKFNEYGNFTMENWANLQYLLKSNLFIIKNGILFLKFILLELQSKEKVTKEMNEYFGQYNSLHLSIRENNEKIKLRLNGVYFIHLA